MHWNHSFQFWWLIPVFLILLCFAMCFVMRRRGIAGCCMSWRGSRDEPWNRRTGHGDEKGRVTAPSTSLRGETQTESQKTTVQDLEQRLGSLEERRRASETKPNPPSNPS